MAHIDNKSGIAAGMMKEMMGPGKMGPDMMKGMIGSGMMGSGLGRDAAKVVVVSTGSSHGFLGRLIRNPVVLIGVGIVTGYLIHKYRNDIISGSSKEE